MKVRHRDLVMQNKIFTRLGLARERSRSGMELGWPDGSNFKTTNEHNFRSEYLRYCSEAMDAEAHG